MRAVSRLARATPMSARACAAAAWLSSWAWWLMASIFNSSALRRAVASSVRALASALARAASALASAARSARSSIWYSAWPLRTRAPSVNRRCCTMPETCGRTSAVSEARVRPGRVASSCCCCVCSVITPTWAGPCWATGLAALSPQAARARARLSDPSSRPPWRRSGCGNTRAVGRWSRVAVVMGAQRNSPGEAIIVFVVWQASVECHRR